jgi:hypothetical protein
VRPADVSDAASATTTADQRKISRGRSADGEEKKSTGDYEVGYGRPPKHSQFPNQHQNKKGRPRKVQNFLTIVEREMDGKVTVLEGEKTRTITKRELAAKRSGTKPPGSCVNRSRRSRNCPPRLTSMRRQRSPTSPP